MTPNIAVCLVLLLSTCMSTPCSSAPESTHGEFSGRQALFDTPAETKLASLLRCVNEKEPRDRTDFLKNGFADADEYGERVAIAAQLHEQFAPLKLERVIESEPHRIVAHCSTSQEVVLQLELSVSPEGTHPIAEVGMEPVKPDEPTELPPGMYPLLSDDNTTARSARGIWHADGYGYVFDVKEDTVTIYSVTKSFAWKQEIEDEMFVTRSSDEDRSQSNDHLVFTFHPLDPGYNVVRLQELPEACGQTFEWTQRALFGAYVEIFEEHYPGQFFEVRNVDWQQRLQDVQPRVSDDMSDSELFDAMAEMVKDLNDGHVSLDASIDGETRSARTGGENTRSRLRASFQPSESFKTYGAYFRAWRDRFKAGIRDQVLGGKSKTGGNNQIIWGHAHEKVGYIIVFGMGGYSFGDTDSQVAELHSTFNEILTELADTESLIVDISFNGGGSDLFSIEIASHFTDERRLGFSKWPDGRKQYRQDRYVTPHTESDMDGAMYLKPVYLVTNDITASAAEIFTMCMRSMPQVTTVGLPTRGALSDVLPKTLPNGWELGLTNEVYVDHAGVCHEGPGIPPQIRMDIFDVRDITKIGHAASIEKVVKLALDRSGK